MKRTVNTSRFGPIEVEDEHVLHLKDGMVGFGHLKDYFLVESPSLPLLLWLQSIDNSEVAFPIVEPYFFERDYSVKMIDADKISLKLEEGNTLKSFVVMTIPQDMEAMTVNMKAPLMINLEKGLGVQVILQDKRYPVRKAAHEAFNKAVSNYHFDNEPEEVEEGKEEWMAVKIKQGEGPNAGHSV